MIHVIRPFSSHRPTEIVSAPKVYGFDTGFVCYHRGWSELRSKDMVLLWEHFVLNELMAHLQSREVRYWHDKRSHEVDFVLVRRRKTPLAIECKWKAETFVPQALLAFRRQYPEGKNFVVAHDIDRAFTRNYNDIDIRFVSLGELIAELEKITV